MFSDEIRIRLHDILFHIKNAIGGYVTAQFKLMGIIFVILSVGLFIAGNYPLMILRLILYVICLLSRQLLQPKIIGDSVGWNPFVTLLLIYVGFKVAGILGFLLAMILGIIFINFYKLGLFDKKIARFKHLILQLQKANDMI